MQWWESAGPQFLKSLGDDLAGISVHPSQVADIASCFSTKLDPETLPLSFTQEDDNETKMRFNLSLTNGRKLWLWTILHDLRNLGPIKNLASHRWTILRTCGNAQFLFSDAPAIKLGLDATNGRNFDGGWDSDGTVLMMPISPEHLLFTEIGRKRLERGVILPEHKIEEVRRHTVNHAYRFVYSNRKDGGVESYRERRVDAHLFAEEKSGWLNWHAEHSRSERD